jgi:TRAP-type C4-dicarboxylate transport system substrate-binding protein
MKQNGEISEGFKTYDRKNRELKMKATILSMAVAATAGLIIAAPAAHSKEVTLKGISGWPKSFPMVAKDFLPFIEEANKRGKGHFKIVWTGGAELGKPPALAKGFKAGIYDVMYTAASYLRGMAPEVDALSANELKPWDARKNGGMAVLNKAMSKRLKGIILVHSASSVQFQLYLRKKPSIGPDGVVSLKGFKMRSVPIYDGFLKGLGATTMTVHVPEIYEALQRGVVDGFPFPNLWTRKFKWQQFVTHTIHPSFYQIEACSFISNKALKKLSPEGRKIMLKVGEDWERTSANIWGPKVAQEREIYKKGGAKEVVMSGAAAKKYITMANETPIQRLKNLKSPEAKELSRLFHGQ